jgi:hypothetical protein
MTVSREAFLAFTPEVRPVVVEYRGKELKFHLRELSGTERNAYESSMVRQQGNTATANMGDYFAKLLVLCLADESGERLFADSERHLVGQRPADLLAKLYEQAAEMNGLTEDAEEALEGNSEAAQSGASTSA